MDNFNFLSGIEDISNLDSVHTTVLIRRRNMKLKTQLTVPKKELQDIDQVKKLEALEEPLKKECLDYPN